MAVGPSNLQDMREVPVGSTRKDRSIHKIFANVSRQLVSYGTLVPIEMDDDETARRSDHRTAYVTADLDRKEVFRWEEYTYRHFSPKAEADFKNWVVIHHWEEVTGASGAENKAEAYQEL